MPSNLPYHEQHHSSSSTTLSNEQTGEKSKVGMEDAPQGRVPGQIPSLAQEKRGDEDMSEPEKFPTMGSPTPNTPSGDPLSQTETAPSGPTSPITPRPGTGRSMTLGTYTTSRMRTRTGQTTGGQSMARVPTEGFLVARRIEEETIADNTPETVKGRTEGPPIYEPLAQKHPGPMEHPSITFGPPAIILLDVIVPIIIYYTWYNSHKGDWERQCSQYTSQGQTCPIQRPEFDKDVLGNTIISFGFGELYILLARVYRLFVHRDQCAPLLSRSKWELDATSWVYAVAMICALIPFVVASTKEIPELYLYSPACLMAFLGCIMLVTLIPFKIPIGINSHVRGTTIRPFCYYAAEDFIAVDGLQDREFRVRFNIRYESSHRFRRMFFLLTLFWMLGVCVYLGAVSAVIWTLPFHYAFGLSLGVLFGYILAWAGMTYFYIQWETSREKAMYEKLGHF